MYQTLWNQHTVVERVAIIACHGLLDMFLLTLSLPIYYLASYAVDLAVIKHLLAMQPMLIIKTYVDSLIRVYECPWQWYDDFLIMAKILLK